MTNKVLNEAQTALRGGPLGNGKLVCKPGSIMLICFAPDSASL